MKKGKIILTLILLILLIGSLLFFTRDTSEVISYIDFKNMIEENNIESVTLTENEIYFNKINDDKKYKTDNPNSDSLKEELLLKDISVTNEKSFVDIFYDAFDVFFIILFLVAIYIIYRRLSGKSLFKVIRKEKTKFTDVVGMDDLKEEMMQVIDIMKHKDKYAKEGIKQPKGIILEGEPGNGKTLFARALAGEANMNFIATKGADFESAVMAVGPQKIRSLFNIAKHHSPVIIFIDEFDGIGTKRNYNGSAIETENTRIVTALLNELDGFKESDGVFVIAATNNSKVLDPALIRPGRFDRKYIIPYPNENDRLELIKHYSKNMKLDNDVNIEKLARELKGASSSRIATIINEAGIIAARKNNNVVNLKCILAALELTKEK
ncbi:MAG: ATP-dependent metallopeptidase FtsH/Yme1/Tma family protein [Clostridia bacterium]|nr:ATP-dependent metallopeptidase FtsH/Yme1/Tma family protein [Clostridia bacterium]